MCGIAGKLVFDASAKVETADIQAMLGPMSHRGPDGQGIHLDRNVGLGHLRLSIIDLSTGAQPMTNEDKTVWVVFNGEIYNFQELRKRLLAKGHVFQSHSDTEVIIHLYEDLGPDCVRELRGMFAFAIWDAKQQRLFVARDRVGIKPLYYCQTDKALYFASELKGIIADRSVSREINLSALRQFFCFNYVPGDETLFKSVRKLLPGHYLTVENGRAFQREYWDLRFTQNRWHMPWEKAVDELHGLLRTVVKDHMIADVPVGVLLSGGVDSSAILSFAVGATDKKVQTFTVGFDGKEVVDERPYAKLSAQKYGTEHHEISITSEDFWNFLPSYVWHMEEPVCEPPAVALYYVSKLARGHVKVLLSGEGGDEAFAGYPNYPNMLRLDQIRAAAGPLARTAGVAATIAGKVTREKRLMRYGAALGRPLSSQYFSRTSGPTAFFNRHAQKFFSAEFEELSSSVSPAGFISGLTQVVNEEPLLNQMLYVDTKTWLPDDLLVKADKITMANSVELRVPLLDHQVLEFAASLPPDFKVRGKETKRILKAAFAEELPAEVLNRKKAGFPVPYEMWLRRDLKREVEDVLLSESANKRGYFRKSEIERLLKANARDGSYSKEVFSLLAVELWHRKFVDEN
ncbi:MAG TPA: asparagine synthase (glutamine-hydrolyzing) [Verrucomicrobiae bacterium]|nr:asparagine synthase (glutamine-hydrolyzing) [Verrucomicrobiae bacterium]